MNIINRLPKNNLGNIIVSIPLLFFFIIYFLCIPALKKLFWFGDAWDLLSQVQAQGFLAWTFSASGENFFPLFKTLWFGSVILFDGDYFVLMTIIWFNHIVNIWILGRLLLKWNMPRVGVFITLTFFGLSLTNIETLGWSVSWASIMATTFLLVVIDRMHVFKEQKQAPHLRDSTLILICVALSALCFSRGVLTGLVLGVTLLLPYFWNSSIVTRAILAIASIAISVAVVITILLISSGNHAKLDFTDFSVLWNIFRWAIYFFSLNPVARLINLGTSSECVIFILLLIKSAIYLCAFLVTPTRTRPLIAYLIIFDIANALLVGIGRYHTGFDAAICSRYQYQPLICFFPCVMILINKYIMKFSQSFKKYAQILLYAVAFVLAFIMISTWSSTLHQWSYWRGVSTVRILESDNPPEVGAIPGIPFLKTEQARRLVKTYNLH
jgi:hypothetical protein